MVNNICIFIKTCVYANDSCKYDPTTNVIGCTYIQTTNQDDLKKGKED